MHLIICQHAGLTMCQQVHQFPLMDGISSVSKWGKAVFFEVKWKQKTPWDVLPSSRLLKVRIITFSSTLIWLVEGIRSSSLDWSKGLLLTHTHTHTLPHLLLHYSSKSNSIHQIDLELLLEYKLHVSTHVFLTVCSDSINNAFNHLNLEWRERDWQREREREWKGCLY